MRIETGLVRLCVFLDPIFTPNNLSFSLALRQNHHNLQSTEILTPPSPPPISTPTIYFPLFCGTTATQNWNNTSSPLPPPPSIDSHPNNTTTTTDISAVNTICSLTKQIAKGICLFRASSRENCKIQSLIKFH